MSRWQAVVSFAVTCPLAVTYNVEHIATGQMITN